MDELFLAGREPAVGDLENLTDTACAGLQLQLILHVDRRLLERIDAEIGPAVGFLFDGTHGGHLAGAARAVFLDAIMDQNGDDLDRKAEITVDAEENPGLAMEYGIMQAPTLLIMHNGVVQKCANVSNIKSYLTDNAFVRK